jgi:hypothetical protein
MQTLKTGQQIYYGGDQCNQSGFGKIVSVEDSPWGIHYNLKMDDGREIKKLPHCAFSAAYLGHGGTRFVTKEAYQTYRAASIAQMKAEFKRIQEKRANA